MQQRSGRFRTALPLLTGVLGLWAGAAAFGARGSAGQTTGWTYASSDHFEVYTSGDEKHARDAITNFERIDTIFNSLVKLPPASRPRTKLVVFSTSEEFAPYRSNANASAFWLNTPDGDFIVMQSLGADTWPTAVHEYTHLMIGRAGLDFPLWLEEGLAQFYSTMTFWGSKMRLGLPPPHAMETLSAAGALIPLNRLFVVNSQSPEERDGRVAPLFYAESWALTHMLLTHGQYRRRIATALAAMASGRRSADALAATYGKSLKEVTADLHNYLRRFRLGSTLSDAPTVPRNAHVASRPASDVEVSVLLASILGWEPGREEQGRAAMEAIEARAPASVRLAEARGLLEVYTRHCDTARTYLDRAVALGSADPAVLRADAELVGPSDPARKDELLGRAAKIAPVDRQATAGPAPPCGAGPAPPR